MKKKGFHLKWRESGETSLSEIIFGKTLESKEDKYHHEEDSSNSDHNYEFDL